MILTIKKARRCMQASLAKPPKTRKTGAGAIVAVRYRMPRAVKRFLRTQPDEQRANVRKMLAKVTGDPV